MCRQRLRESGRENIRLMRSKRDVWNSVSYFVSRGVVSAITLPTKRPGLNVSLLKFYWNKSRKSCFFLWEILIPALVFTNQGQFTPKPWFTLPIKFMHACALVSRYTTAYENRSAKKAKIWECPIPIYYVSRVMAGSVKSWPKASNKKFIASPNQCSDYAH